LLILPKRDLINDNKIIFVVKYLLKKVKTFMKIVSFLFALLLFSGCDFIDDIINTQTQKELKKQQHETKLLQAKLKEAKEVQLKEIDAQTRQELAKIEAQKELEKLKKEQMLEKIRLEADLQKQKVQLQMEKDKALLAQKMSQMQLQSDMEIKRYFVGILLVVLLIATYFIYLYFRIRHQNKLQAYQDNLEKYFHQQENMTKMRIAEKIIDTVASGKLDKAQERELIKALNGNMSQTTTNEPKLLSDDVEAEIIDDEDEKK
jgi:biopolymer transport protein ExbB/TolQ